MSGGVHQFLFSPMVLLWLAGSLAAVVILLGAVNRRRSGLTDSLRGYVDRSQEDSQAVPHTKAAPKTDQQADG